MTGETAPNPTAIAVVEYRGDYGAPRGTDRADLDAQIENAKTVIGDAYTVLKTFYEVDSDKVEAVAKLVEEAHERDAEGIPLSKEEVLDCLDAL
ncbi:hypothetical protein ACFL1B_02745 [Nanoarchaeota archaeon]